MLMILKFDTQSGRKVRVQVPAKYRVCQCCSGSGTELYGSMKGYAYSADELNDDPDFAESIMQGNYDVPCESCKGQRVELEPDLQRLSPRQKRIVISWEASLSREARERQADRETYWAESGTAYSERY